MFNDFALKRAKKDNEWMTNAFSNRFNGSTRFELKIQTNEDKTFIASTNSFNKPFKLN
jgi:hypothetical protein